MSEPTTSAAARLALHGGRPAIREPLPTIRNASGRLLGAEERAEVLDALESGTLAYIYGRKVRAFEERFAELLGVERAVAVSSGTAALHTALVYIDPDPGDEILVSPITDMGSVIPILYQQAVPVFVDVDPATQNMDPGLIERHISPRTRAVMVTHMYGAAADMDPIMEIAARRGLFVIEDCAQAHMATYRGRRVGAIGDLGCFSFQQSKHITTGDGGMVVARDDDARGRLLRLCHDKGWPREIEGRDHLFLAPNYHMTELQAAVGLAQIRKYDTCLSARREAAQELDALLAPDPAVEPVRALPECEHTYFYYALRVSPDAMRAPACEVVDALRAEGLPAEHGYPGPIPLYLYPMIAERRTFGASGWPFTSPAARREWTYPPGLCPAAEEACRHTVALPWNEGLRSRHVRLMFEALRKVLDAFRL